MNKLRIHLLSITFILVATPVQAFDLFGSNAYETKDPALQKYLEFVKKDGRCDFAVAIAPRSSSTKIQRSIYDRYSSILRCIGKVTFREGTINEISGCTAFYLDPTNKRTSSFLPPQFGGDYSIAKGKGCSEAFDELVRMPVRHYTSISVGSILSGKEGLGGTPLYGGHGADLESESFLIYSNNKKFTDWYFSEKLKTEEEIRKVYLKAKKEGSLNPYVSGEIIKSPVTDEKTP